MAQLRTILHTLPGQLTLGFVGVIIFTALAAWFPELWLMQRQLDRQAWAQVEQGRQAASALYRNWEREISTLANLTAHLPQLRALVQQGSDADLLTYLGTLDANLSLDLILVCRPDGHVRAFSGTLPTAEWCAATGTSYQVLPGEPPQLWLLAAQPIEGEQAPLGSLVAGLRLGDAFAQQMAAQTGVAHTLLVQGQPIATSLPTLRRSNPQAIPLHPANTRSRHTFELAGRPFFASDLAITPQVHDRVALDVTPLIATERQLFRTQAASLLLVMLAGSLVGRLLARRIGQPLSELSAAASRLSQGDLDTPLAATSQVREVALVTHALEHARQDLRHSLTSLQQEKAWISHLLEAIVEGIVTLDEQGRITFWSQGAERITDWPRAQVLDRHCDEIFTPVGQQVPFTELIPPPAQRRKITVRLGDGSEATLSVTHAELTPVEAGNARLALVFRDVSEEEAVQRLLGHFMANVTHEFRTPLSALAAAIELLLDQAEQLSHEELQELLLSLHLGTLSLQTLVDNLLESASLETGRFRVFPRPADLGEIIGEAARTMRPLLEKYEQPLEINLPTPPLFVQADPRRTGQVLINLLSNAAKYGAAGQVVTISTERWHGQARVMVADRGPGVPEAQRGALFHRFSHFATEDNASRYGSGLGLWVVKAIVEAQGGSVGVEARAEGGSTFWFTLPLAVEV